MLNIYNQQRSDVAPPTQNSTQTHADFRKYSDPTGEFDSKELSYSMWYVKHRLLLYRLSVFTLVVVNIFLILLAGAKWVYFIATIPGATQVENDLAKAPNYTMIQQQQMPKPLKVGDTVLFSDGSNTYGIASEVTNPNERFISSFTYYFVANGAPTEKKQISILPKQTMLVPALGQSGQAGSARLVIESPGWQRLSPHAVAVPGEVVNNRLHFTVDSFNFSSAFETAGLNVGRITFNLTNDSAFGYREPRFYIGLYNVGALVGVVPLQFDTFKSGEVKAVDQRLFTNNMRVDSVQVYPEINVFDDEVYLAPE